MIRFSASFPRLALGATAALAAISLSPGSAQAFVVTVGGTQYDVTTFTGRADANAVKFNTPANGGMMPWYGNGSLAIDFALAVQGFLAIELFMLLHWICPVNLLLESIETLNTAPNLPPSLASTAIQGGGNSSAATETYAVAKEVPTSVPAPLPLFGAAAAFGFSRKLRQRIKLAPGALGSALPRA